MTANSQRLAGSLQAEDLGRFAPLGYPAIADAYRLGYMKIPALRKLFEKPGVAISEPSKLLTIFLNTAATFDRGRDIGEELDRLKAKDTSGRPPLWMLLARIIIEKYHDPSEALQMLEYVFEDADYPTGIEPFRLYNNPPPPGVENPGANAIASLNDYLVKHGVS